MAAAPSYVGGAGPMHVVKQDNIDEITPATRSATRVVYLVKRYGRNYAGGELSHDERGNAITGSEIPSICSENRFETPNSVFFKKVFHQHTPGNVYTEHGKYWEPIAIEKFRQKTGAKLFFVGFMRHEEYGFLGGTFDALAIMPDGEGVLVEVKCPYTRGICMKVPEHYIGQIQIYMEIADLDRCEFVQFKPSYYTAKRAIKKPETLLTMTVQRDKGYFVAKMPTLWSFWKRLCGFRAGVAPVAGLASNVIKTAWKFYKSKTAILEIGHKLVCASFKYNRVKLCGIDKTIEAELESFNKPKMPTLPLRPGVVLKVDPFAFSSPVPIKLVVMDYEQPKPKRPPSADIEDESDLKKSKQ